MRARVMEGEDELPELGRTLDKLARGLSSSLKELRAERDRMAGILEGMQEGVILLDAKRRIVVLNPALREMLLLPADAIGKPLLEVVRNAELRDLVRCRSQRRRRADHARGRDRQHQAAAACWRVSRACRVSSGNSWQFSSTLPRCAGSSRCAKTSSPTCRTSCARR